MMLEPCPFPPEIMPVFSGPLQFMRRRERSHLRAVPISSRAYRQRRADGVPHISIASVHKDPHGSSVAPKRPGTDRAAGFLPALFSATAAPRPSSDPLARLALIRRDSSGFQPNGVQGEALWGGEALPCTTVPAASSFAVSPAAYDTDP